MDQFLSLIVQYGLPSVALIFVVWASATGKIVWKPTLDAKDERIADLREQLNKVDQDKDKALEGWVRTLSTSQTVARAATQAIDIAERRSES